jgi:hypothetical protein
MNNLQNHRRLPVCRNKQFRVIGMIFTISKCFHLSKAKLFDRENVQLLALFFYDRYRADDNFLLVSSIDQLLAWQSGHKVPLLPRGPPCPLQLILLVIYNQGTVP